MVRRALAATLFFWLGAAWCASPDDLKRQQEQAHQQQTQLRARIKQLQTNIDAQVAKRNTADLALKESEAAISNISRQLENLNQQQQHLESEIKSLSEQAQEADGNLLASRAVLANQLRAQYQSGLSPWVSLLSGNDPSLIGRELSYMSYITKAQSKTVQNINNTIAKIDALHVQAKAKQEKLSELAQQASIRQKELTAQQHEREAVLKKIEAQLQDQRGQQQQMVANEARLGKLIADIEVEIDRAVKAAAAAAAKEASEAAEEVSSTDISTGLEKGLLKPVNGSIIGRFGAERPEGGVWRGVILLAKQGTKVHAVASGQVVYSSWLSGFGNILIIDHGQQYLSVYAYNHSLLKEVGDTVLAREVVATVGSTGGQVESGLYFEIRHQGKPVNPVLWLKP